MKTNIKNSQAGFSLIEYIASIVLVAIVAAMVFSFFGSSFTQSIAPKERLKQSSDLVQVMERITADYNRLNALNLRYYWQASTPYSMNSIVTPSVSNGHFYKCKIVGTSGATEPSSWPTNTGGEVTDGSVTWKESGVIWAPSPTIPNESIVWQVSHLYAINDLMIPITNNGHYYKCASGGTSSSKQPTTWKASYALYNFGDIVFTKNGRCYQITVCNNSQCTSGATEPAWPAADGVTLPLDGTITWKEVPDGTVRWKEVGTILARSDTAPLSTGNEAVLNDNILNYLTNNPARYGTSYTVVTAETRFIQYNGSNQVDAGSSEKNILKVSVIDNNSAETLTAIFTIR